jgi:hypothetical protein
MPIIEKEVGWNYFMFVLVHSLTDRNRQFSDKHRPVYIKRLCLLDQVPQGSLICEKVAQEWVI